MKDCGKENILAGDRFEGFNTVTKKNGVFWDIKTQFELQRRHITPPLQSLPS
jgi:hypothetical protein